MCPFSKFVKATRTENINGTIVNKHIPVKGKARIVILNFSLNKDLIA